MQGQMQDYFPGEKKSQGVNDIKDLYRILYQTPLLGFNSGRYDLNVVKNELFSIIDAKMVIKNPNYMCISTENLKILDIKNYLPPDASFDKYVTTYLGGCKCDNEIECTCQLAKGFFPYEYLDSYDILSQNKLPPVEAFNSEFRQTTMDVSKYERMKWVWNHYGMKKGFGFARMV